MYFCLKTYFEQILGNSFGNQKFKCFLSIDKLLNFSVKIKSNNKNRNELKD